MSKQDNLTDFLTDVADAIRAKKSTTEKINPQNFSEEIRGIESGGGWDFLGDIDSLRDNFFTHSTGRTYVKVDIRDYSYLKVEIDFKGDYRLGLNIVSSYESGAGDNLYDSGWIYSNGNMGVYLIALNYKNSNYLRVPFVLNSSINNTLDYEEIKAVYTFKVYGAKKFNWSKKDIADVNHATKSFVFVSMPTREVEFGEKLKSVENIFKSMQALDTVIFHSKTPPNMIADIGNPSKYTIYVPDESVEAYKSATNWSNYADYIKPLSEYVEPTTE